MTSERRDPDTTSGWVIGHVGRAPVILTPSWLIAPVVITLLFAPTVRTYAPELGTVSYLVAAAFALLLLLSVFLHELAHALVARARGQHVKELAITVWGGRTSFDAAAPTPGTSALVAVVGPVANGLVAALCWGLVQATEPGTVVTLVLYAGLVSNVFVAVFNMLPGLPMDGGYILEALVWRLSGDRSRGTLAAGWFGRGVVVLVAAWILVPSLLSGRAPDLVMVGWGALIGAFLWSGAGQSIAAARAQLRVRGLGLGDLGVRAVGLRDVGTVAAAIQEAVRAGADAIVVLDHDGRPRGYVDQAAAATVPVDRRATTALDAVTVAIPADALIDARLTGDELVRAVGVKSQVSPVLVAVVPGPDGPLVHGLVRVQDVVAALRAPRLGSRG